MPQELFILSEFFDRNIHKSTPLRTTFQAKVNEYLKQGWRVINCVRSGTGTDPSFYEAFLVRDI